jgi:hypothetical protein
MIGALIVAIICVGGVLLGTKLNEEKKPKSMTLAIICAIVGAVAILIAFPQILSVGGTATSYVLIIVGLLGAILVLAARTPRIPSWFGLIVGMTMIAWALFRWLPTGPAAFLYLGQHATTAGNAMWEGLKGFVKILSGSGPIKHATKK